jgi:hypothetical protein
MLATRKAILFVVTLLLGTTAWAQEYPRNEVAVDYSYAYYVPSTGYSKATNQSLNGGGGAYVFNFSPYLGFKVDLQGYGSFTNNFTIPVSTNFPQGGLANVQGNLFTYLFGPQVKFRTHFMQPYGNLLVGAAHSNLYGNAYKDCGSRSFVALAKRRRETPLLLRLAVGWTSRLGTMSRFVRQTSITCLPTFLTHSTMAARVTGVTQPE